MLQTQVLKESVQILQGLPLPMVEGKILRDDAGQAVDFVFLDANHAYNQDAAVPFAQLQGKKYSEVFRGQPIVPPDRITAIDQTLQGSSGVADIEFYSHHRKAWSQVRFIRLEKDRFLAVFSESPSMTAYLEKLTRIISFTEAELRHTGSVDYCRASRILREMTGARFVLMNVRSDTADYGRTVGLAADPGELAIVENELGYALLGALWPDAWHETLSDEQVIKRTETLHEAIYNQNLAALFTKAEIQFNLGETVIARIGVAGREVGYFLFSLPIGMPFGSEELVRVFVDCVGLVEEWKASTREIRQRSNRFMALFEQMGSGATIYTVTNDGSLPGDYVIKEINAAGLLVHGLDLPSCIGKTLAELNHDLEQSTLLKLLQNVWQTGKPEYAILSLTDANGKLSWWENRIFKLSDNEVAAIYNDVSDRIEAEEKLLDSEERLTQLINHMHQALALHEMIYDDTGTPVDYRYIQVNPHFEVVTGLQAADVIGRTKRDISAVVDEEWIRRCGEVVATGMPLEREEYAATVDRYYHIVAYRPQAGMFATIATDITERKRAEQQLQHQSTHDHLTGLYNRHYFDRELKRLDQQEEYPLTILLADMDDLKIINDVFGHQQGDEAIRTVAHIMQKNAPAGSVLARTGGDEFTLLLPNTSDSEAMAVISRIRAALAESNGPLGAVSVSMGIASKTESIQPVGDVFKRAEDMMYRNKVFLRSSSSAKTVELVMAALRAKNTREGIHADQVAAVAAAMGEAMGLSHDSLQELKTAALLHDIGKIGVPDRILDKPEPLTREEYRLVQKHCESGYMILRPIPELESVAATILAHHEHWDGKGYPYGLAGTQIPLHARIIAVADTLSAMLAKRPFREQFTADQVNDEIVRCAGTQFDPDVVDIFCVHQDELLELL